MIIEILGGAALLGGILYVVKTAGSPAKPRSRKARGDYTEKQLLEMNGGKSLPQCFDCGEGISSGVLCRDCKRGRASLRAEVNTHRALDGRGGRLMRGDSTWEDDPEECRRHRRMVGAGRDCPDCSDEAAYVQASRRRANSENPHRWLAGDGERPPRDVPGLNFDGKTFRSVRGDKKLKAMLPKGKAKRGRSK